MTIVQLALAGIGIGGAYALLSCGVVTIYRGTGVPNFAQGAIAMLCAFFFFRLRDDWGWHTAPAFVATVAFGAALGVAFHFLVIRQLRTSPMLARIVATLALITLLQGVALQWFDVTTRTPSAVLPQELVDIGRFTLVSDRIWLAIIAVGTAVLLGVLSYTTKIGLAVRAVAENEKGALLQGYSTNALSALTWALGSALAAVAGVLVSPIAGLDANALTLLVVPVFSAALIARFSSYFIAVAAAFALGAVQSILQSYDRPGEWWEFLWKGPGRAQAFPAMVIIVVMLLSGKLIPSRGAAAVGRMPLSPLPRHTGAYTAIGCCVAAACVLAFPRSWTSALNTTLIAAIIALSFVVVTGFAGQISLAQMSFAGVAGLVTSSLTTDLDVPLPFPIIASGLVAALVGIVLGATSVRVRGPSLAIVTLGGAWILQRVVFQNNSLVGDGGFARVSAPSLFGQKLDHRGFGLLVIAILALLAAMVTRLRRSRTGRRFLTVRENERAAAAAGVAVARVKLQAFAISAFIAGVGGSLLSYNARAFAWERYTVFESLFLIVSAYLGGIGMVAGAVVAGTAVSGGIFAKLLSEWGLAEYHRIIGGIGLLIVIQLHPDGLASTAAALRRHRRQRPRHSGDVHHPPSTASDERPSSVPAAVGGAT